MGINKSEYLHTYKAHPSQYKKQLQQFNRKSQTMKMKEKEEEILTVSFLGIMTATTVFSPVVAKETRKA